MNYPRQILFSLVFPFMALIFSSCMATGFPGFGSGSGGLSISPNATTVDTGQTTTFQTSGGTPPYQYQVSGVGIVDGSGDYQAGNTAGSSQVIVTDSLGATSTASISVVQTGTSAISMWTPTTRAEQKSAPFVQGPVLGVSDRTLDAQGDRVHSQFISTQLRHPLVRMDELIENQQIVAVHALIEDQFIVKLQPGYSESDLAEIARQAGAHISRQSAQLRYAGTYLVSLNHGNHGNQTNRSAAPAVTADFLAARKALKQQLQAISQVTPNMLSRAPASQ